MARLEPGDLVEDAAAEAVARALHGEPPVAGLSRSAAFTGRVNLFAEVDGLLRVDRAAVDALNAIDPAVTLATLPDFARVRARQMVATVKVIPYAVAGDVVARAVEIAPPFRLEPFRPGRATLILTRTPGMSEALLAKGAAVMRARLAALRQEMGGPVTVAHEARAVAAAIAAADGDMVLILGASATSDVARCRPGRAGGRPAGGCCASGCRSIRGTCSFIGEHGGRPVVGLPGCARSPALNGADWVLERLAAGIAVGDAEIAAMGVGGLLKEIPIGRSRAPDGRRWRPGPHVAALVLAAGAARRMRGRDKLLEPVGGRPVLRATVEAAAASRADEVVVVLPPGAEARRAAIAGAAVRTVEAADWAEGMAASMRAGLAAVSGRADAVVVLLADMPEVGAADIDRLIAAFDPAEGREICRAVSADGKPGHPVLFGRRFFEALAGADRRPGARDVVRDAADLVVEVPTPGQAAVVDLDTPEEWAAWRVTTGQTPEVAD